MSSPITVVGAQHQHQHHPSTTNSASAKPPGPVPSGPPPPPPPTVAVDRKDLPRQVTWNERDDADADDSDRGEGVDGGHEVEHRHGGGRRKREKKEEEPRRRRAHEDSESHHHRHRPKHRRNNDDDGSKDGVAPSGAARDDGSSTLTSTRARGERVGHGGQKRRKTEEELRRRAHENWGGHHHRRHRPEQEEQLPRRRNEDDGRPKKNWIAQSGTRDGPSTATSTSAANLSRAATDAREVMVEKRAVAAVNGPAPMSAPAGGVVVRGKKLGRGGEKIVVGLGGEGGEGGEGESSERWLADLCLRRRWTNLGRLVSSRPHLALATFRVSTAGTVSSILHEALRDPLGEGDESEWTADTRNRMSLIRTILEVEPTSADLQLPSPAPEYPEGGKDDNFPDLPPPSSSSIALPIFFALRTDPNAPAHPRTPNAARAEVVRLLLAARTRANQPDDAATVPLMQPGDRTPLHVAVEEGCDAAVVHVLLNDHDPDDLVDRADSDGYLPLHRACCGPGLPPTPHGGCGRRRPVENPMSALLVVTLLVRKRPSTLHAVTRAGDTPLSLAREALDSLRRRRREESAAEGDMMGDGDERAMGAIVNFLTEASGGMKAAGSALTMNMNNMGFLPPHRRPHQPHQPRFFTSAEEAANAVDVERRRAMAMAAAAGKLQHNPPLPPTTTTANAASVATSARIPDKSRATAAGDRCGMTRPPPHDGGGGNDRKRRRREAGHDDFGGSADASTGCGEGGGDRDRERDGDRGKRRPDGAAEFVVPTADGAPRPRRLSKPAAPPVVHAGDDDHGHATVRDGTATTNPAGGGLTTDVGEQDDDLRRYALIVGTLKRRHNEVMRGFLRREKEEGMKTTHPGRGSDVCGSAESSPHGEQPPRRLPKLPPSGTTDADGVVGKPPPPPIPTWEVLEDRVILRYLPSRPQPPTNDSMKASGTPPSPPRATVTADPPRSSSLGGDEESGETSRPFSSSSASGGEGEPNVNTNMNLNLAEENVRLMDRLISIEVEHRRTVRGMEREHDRALLERSAALRADVRREGDRHAADLERAEEEFRRGFKIGRIMSGGGSSVSTEGGGVARVGGKNVGTKDEPTLRRSRCSTGPEASVARTYRPLL